MFFKAWDFVLQCTGDVASQSLFKFNQTESRLERKGEKNTRKSRGKVQTKTRKILQPPVATGTGATYTDEGLPASLASKSDVKPGPEFFFQNQNRGTGATKSEEITVRLIPNV